MLTFHTMNQFVYKNRIQQNFFLFLFCIQFYLLCHLNKVINHLIASFHQKELFMCALHSFPLKLFSQTQVWGEYRFICRIYSVPCRPFWHVQNGNMMAYSLQWVGLWSVLSCLVPQDVVSLIFSSSMGSFGEDQHN